MTLDVAATDTEVRVVLQVFSGIWNWFRLASDFGRWSPPGLGSNMRSSGWYSKDLGASGVPCNYQVFILLQVFP